MKRRVEIDFCLSMELGRSMRRSAFSTANPCAISNILLRPYLYITLYPICVSLVYNFGPEPSSKFWKAM